VDFGVYGTSLYALISEAPFLAQLPIKIPGFAYESAPRLEGCA